MAMLSSPGFSIHEDDDPFAVPQSSSSPTRPDATEDEYEADDSVLTSDEVMPVMDVEAENVPILPSSPPPGKIRVKVTPRYVSSATKSSRQSEISSLPGSIPYDDRDMSPYVPMKHRPIYRDGSTRPLQMASPPGIYSPSRSSSYLRERTYDSPKSERRMLSPRSQTSHSNSTMRSSRHGTPSVLQTPTKEEHPLVLLHVTILPQPWPYSTKSMEAVLPGHIIENQRTLEEKLNPTILARGLLLSHPGEEYDLLEERILESLELRTPRILKCGHYYHGDDDKDEQDPGSGSSSSPEDSVAIGSGSHTHACAVARDSSEHMVFDASAHCATCHQSLGLPGAGAGEPGRKFDVKVYAANGLMRAGAWAAAWREMEKVDVEIGTWAPDHLRRELDLLLEEEERDAIREAQDAEARRFRAAEVDEGGRGGGGAENGGRGEGVVDRGRATGILTPPPDEPVRAAGSKTQRYQSPGQREAQVSLATLLQNYVLVLAQDRRNLAIALLSMLVLLISLRAGSRAHESVARSSPHTMTVTQVVGETATASASTVLSVSTAVSISTVTLVESASLDVLPAVSGAGVEPSMLVSAAEVSAATNRPASSGAATMSALLPASVAQAVSDPSVEAESS